MNTVCMTLVASLLFTFGMACSAAADPLGLRRISCDDGSSFELSMDYPQSEPPAESPWKGIDFKENPGDYLRALRDYVYEGNLNADWQGQENTVRRWYHVPWLHLGDRGRECRRGLTRERDSRPGELDLKQVTRFQNWGVAMYNAPGGFTIGQVWKSELPDVSDVRFPPGTVAVKLLLTEAGVEQVPRLRRALEWRAMINSRVDDVKSPRVERTLRLLQLDVAVRDPGADAQTGWVFGTFVYNHDAPGESPWEKMEPIGLMWGNDPKLVLRDLERKRIAVMQKEKLDPIELGTLEETKLNPEIAVPHFLGWGGRLNGLVDNPVSSCLSCHSTAEFPQRSPLAPPLERYFRNIPAGQAFDEGLASLDYSLQLAQSVTNFCSQEELSLPAKFHCSALEAGYEPGRLPSAYQAKVGLPISRDEATQTEEDFARQPKGGLVAVRLAWAAIAGAFILGGVFGGGAATMYHRARRLPPKAAARPAHSA